MMATHYEVELYEAKKRRWVVYDSRVSRNAAVLLRDKLAQLGERVRIQLAFYQPVTCAERERGQKLLFGEGPYPHENKGLGQ